MIALFVEKENEQASLALRDALQNIPFPEQVQLTINNLEDAESGLRRHPDGLVEISLAQCFGLEDVVRELVKVVGVG